jgi:hypothetical protein
MPKKKKQKEDKKEKQKEYSLEEALKSSQKTGSDLQEFLSTLNTGQGFYQRTPKKEEVKEIKEEENIGPQLSYDSDSSKKIAEDYMNENVPISERKSQSEDKIKAPPKPPEATEENEAKAPSKDTQGAPPKPPAKSESIKKEPSFVEEKSKGEKEPEISIYAKLSEFFKELFEGYEKRYDRWEESINALLSVLRKMRKITKNDTKELVSGIENIYGEIQTRLEQFKTKRDEIEKVSGVNVEEMSAEFKKVIGLMSIQLKEYRLRKLTDELLY